jgi:NTE family protein
MTLSTLINASLTRPTKPRTALVLMGGGARTAYQSGVLQAIAQLLREQAADVGAAYTHAPSRAPSLVSTVASSATPAATPPALASATPSFPFPILLGTSAGALNASYLACRADQGLGALDALAHFWHSLRSEHVYQLQVSPWVRLSRIGAAWTMSKQVRSAGSLLNNMPMVDTLHKAIMLNGIEAALESKALHALAVTASSYTSGVHWTFCHTARDTKTTPLLRPGRRVAYGPIGIEHLMASSALPLIFPATPLWVDGGQEYFGDGSMRQTSPLSPALHLGAHKILVVGVGQPQRSTFVNPGKLAQRAPGLGGILGHAMASVFHDTLLADVEQAQRVNATLQQLPREVAAVLPYRQLQVMSLQPSESLDAIAHRFVHTLPQAARNMLAGLGANGMGAAALTSYLLFEPGFIDALMDLGQRDAHEHKKQLLAFFAA